MDPTVGRVVRQDSHVQKGSPSCVAQARTGPRMKVRHSGWNQAGSAIGAAPSAAMSSRPSARASPPARTRVRACWYGQPAASQRGGDGCSVSCRRRRWRRPARRSPRRPGFPHDEPRAVETGAPVGQGGQHSGLGPHGGVPRAPGGVVPRLERLRLARHVPERDPDLTAVQRHHARRRQGCRSCASREWAPPRGASR